MCIRICFRQMRAQQGVIWCNPQPFFEILDSFLSVSTENPRRLLIDLPENHVCAASLVALIDLQYRFHFTLDILYLGQARQCADLGAATIICPKPEVAVSFAALRLNRKFSRGNTITKCFVLLSLDRAVCAEIITELRHAPG